MNLRKIVVIALASIFLTACGGSSEDKSTTEDNERTTICKSKLKERVGEDVEQQDDYDKLLEDCVNGEGLPH